MSEPTPVIDETSIGLADLDPEELAAATTRGEGAANVFGLPELRDKVGRQGGDVAGLGTGSSIDFHDHRIYLPGDDVRHINWQAYGRTGTYSMKLFREEVQPLIDVVLDLSGSMFCGPDKARRTAELVSFASFSAARAQASARFWVVGGDQPVAVPPEDLFAGVWPRSIPGAEVEDEDVRWNGDLAAVPFRRGSVRVLLGDLLHDSPPSQTLMPLANGAGLALIWAPFSTSESDPPWQDACDLEDAESGSLLPVWADRGMLRRYQEAYRRHFDLWGDAARQLGVRLARIPANGDLHDGLLSVAGENRAIRLMR